jgi:hypothetical protein
MGGVRKLVGRKPTWVLSKIGKHVGEYFLNSSSGECIPAFNISIDNP